METTVRIYDGPCPEVDIPLNEPFTYVDEDGEQVTVHTIKAEHGEPVTLPAPVAEGLDPQGDWLLEDGSLPEAAKPNEERTFSVKELRAVAKDLDIKIPAGSTKEQIEALIDEHSRAKNAEGESGGQTPETGDDQAAGDPAAATTAADGE